MEMIFLGFMVVLSTVFAASSSSVILFWLSIEVNMVSLLVFLSGIPRAKYFMAQWLGSCFILLGLICGQSVFVLVGISVKIGLFPFHFWVPQVMQKMSWGVVGILSTWQKIAPLSLIFCFDGSVGVIEYFGVMSVVVGALGAMKQSNLRSLVAYTSVSYMGWACCAYSVSDYICFVFLVSYCFSSIPFFWGASKMGAEFSFPTNFCSFLCLGSIAGVPPFVGLWAKYLILSICPVWMSVFMVFSSGVLCLVYLSLMISCWNKPKSQKKLSVPWVMVIILIMPILMF